MQEIVLKENLEKSLKNNKIQDDDEIEDYSDPSAEFNTIEHAEKNENFLSSDIRHEHLDHEEESEYDHKQITQIFDLEAKSNSTDIDHTHINKESFEGNDLVDEEDDDKPEIKNVSINSSNDNTTEEVHTQVIEDSENSEEITKTQETDSLEEETENTREGNNFFDKFLDNKITKTTTEDVDYYIKDTKEFERSNSSKNLFNHDDIKNDVINELDDETTKDFVMVGEDD
ncbi:hypothetical protein [Mycoplasma struthionis]|uniref:Uncharacterized protein n=1 Tax=Mycoplasma struthionis TaxID=538220 RepID=A0A3G8LJU0_9MOLU|nr:hypothetical protein [Mycoplasma struthionis]AZG68908.1 hypothetical protein EGN60_03090 [Mycoplasma struthionis]